MAFLLEHFEGDFSFLFLFYSQDCAEPRTPYYPTGMMPYRVVATAEVVESTYRTNLSNARGGLRLGKQLQFSYIHRSN